MKSKHFVTDDYRPCSENPCEGNGTCEEHDGTFTCFCTSDRTGIRCERTLDVGGIQVIVDNWFFHFDCCK